MGGEDVAPPRLWLLSRLAEEFPAYRIEELECHPDVMKLMAIIEMRAYAAATRHMEKEDGAKDLPGSMVSLVLRVKKQNAKEDRRRGDHR